MIGLPDFVKNPDKYRDMNKRENVETAFSLACAFWKDKRLSDLAESGGLNEPTCTRITKVINGGYNGLRTDRRDFKPTFKENLKVMSD